MQISEAEWVVMNLVWDRQPVDARTVIEELSEKHQWSAATIKTMLHRLVKKQALSHKADGKRYLYRASVRRNDCVRRESKSFLTRVFGGDAAPALLHFVKNSKLTADEVKQLRELLDEKDRRNDQR